MKPGLVCQGLGVKLGRRDVLEDLDFTLGSGGIHGLIGPNGAGKTTLLRALAGLLPLDRGKITLDETNLDSISRTQRAREIGYLPQNGSCHWPLPVERLVELGRIPHLENSDTLTPADRDAVRKALEQTDTWDLRHRTVTELSGGERARVLLARVLAGGPRVLLVDEPLAGLDLYHQLQVMELLQHTATEPGRLVCVVMHDLSLALRHCTVLTLLDRGKALWSGSPADLLKAGQLDRIFHVELQAFHAARGPALVPVRRLDP